MFQFPHETSVANSAAKAAPWCVAVGVIGVAAVVVAGHGPLLTSLALIGIGSDADLARRLRDALAADGDAPFASDAARIAGFFRRLHASMYAMLVVVAWASLLHLAGQNGPAPLDARWRLAGDLAIAATLALGYARLARRRG